MEHSYIEDLRNILANRDKYAKKVFEKIMLWPGDYIILTCEGQIYPKENFDLNSVLCEGEKVLYIYDPSKAKNLAGLEEEIEDRCLRMLK